MIVVMVIQVMVVALVCVNAAMSAFFALCVLLGAAPARRALHGATRQAGALVADDPGPRTAVVIPAHNEQDVIDQTIAAAQASVPVSFEIVIVADNCTDATADLARVRGVRVLERSHATDRGKGFALAAAFEMLKADRLPPQVVLVLDADSRIDDRVGGAGIVRFVQECHEKQCPMQMASLIEVPEDSRPRERIAAFAFRVKGLVRNLGLKRLGGGCQLGGTGMALPFDLVDGAKLASGETVEDMRLGIELAASGSAPRYSVDCFVRSPAASSDSGFVSQRTRWEQGHLRMIARFGPVLLLRGLGSWKLLLMGADLCVPFEAASDLVDCVDRQVERAPRFHLAFEVGCDLLALEPQADSTAVVGQFVQSTFDSTNFLVSGLQVVVDLFQFALDLGDGLLVTSRVEGEQVFLDDREFGFSVGHGAEFGLGLVDEAGQFAVSCH